MAWLGMALLTRWFAGPRPAGASAGWLEGLYSTVAGLPRMERGKSAKRKPQCLPVLDAAVHGVCQLLLTARSLCTAVPGEGPRSAPGGRVQTSWAQTPFAAVSVDDRLTRLRDTCLYSPPTCESPPIA